MSEITAYNTPHSSVNNHAIGKIQGFKIERSAIFGHFVQQIDYIDKFKLSLNQNWEIFAFLKSISYFKLIAELE